MASARAIMWLALIFLEEDKLPPKNVLRFFVQVANDPNRYSEIMKPDLWSSNKGRPSIDDKRIKLPAGFKLKKFFGDRPTERYAAMIGYLITQGYIISEEGNYKESAVQIVSELTGRSAKALQKDYYKHKEMLEKYPSVLEVAEVRLRLQYKWEEKKSKPSY